MKPTIVDSLDDLETIAGLLYEGRIGVLPTDTLYGIVGSALSKEAVNSIYKLKNRTNSKPLILLIYSLDQLSMFDIIYTPAIRSFMNNWPDKTTIIVTINDNEKKYEYLHRGTYTLGFRKLSNFLVPLLETTGPIVAPSANPEGLPPASSIPEALNYFSSSDAVSFYVDGGNLQSAPSEILDYTGTNPTRIR